MSRFSTIPALIAAAAALTSVPEANAAQTAQLPADDAAVTDSLSRAVATVFGTMVNTSLGNMQAIGAKVDMDIFCHALTEVLRGRSAGFDYNEADRYVEHYMIGNRTATTPASVTPESQQAYIDSVAAVDGAVITPLGVVFRVITEGEGTMPADGDRVLVNYTARLSDGTVFDRTEQPITLDVDVSRLIPGFTETLKMMRPGGSYNIVIPASAGYGAEGIPGAIPGNSILDFTVDLIGIVPPPTSNIQDNNQ